jgi:hypothetical protein
VPLDIPTKAKLNYQKISHGLKMSKLSVCPQNKYFIVKNLKTYRVENIPFKGVAAMWQIVTLFLSDISAKADISTKPPLSI